MINVDDLNDWVEPLGGHADTLTPNLTRLAQRGMNFTNAHATVTACNGSRASFLTGMLPSTTLIHYNNQANFRALSPAIASATTLPQAFKDAGYTIKGGGKLFHSPTSDHVAHGGGTNWDEWWDGNTVAPHGHHPNLKYAGGLTTPLNGFAGKTLQFADGATVSIEDDWGAIPDENANSTAMYQVADWARHTIQQTGQERVFISAGLSLPHIPMYYPAEVLSRFDVDSIELPPFLANDQNDVPNYWATRTNTIRNFTQEATIVETGATRGDVWHDMVVSYLASVAYLDDMVGVMLDAVEARDDADEWTIVFLSDHGYHLGEKDHVGKLTLWEEATRVPFLYSGPGVAVGETNAAVSLVDLFPTLVDRAGLASSARLQGRSLSGLLENPDLPDDGVAISNRGAIVSMRTQQFRYTRYRNGYEEVYDHDTDPNEWHNLQFDPAYEDARRRLRRQFHVWSIESGNVTFSLENLSEVPTEGSRALHWFDGKTGVLDADPAWTSQVAGLDFTLLDGGLSSPSGVARATEDSVNLAERQDFQVAVDLKLPGAGSQAGIAISGGDSAGLDLTLAGDGRLLLGDSLVTAFTSSLLNKWHTLVAYYDVNAEHLEVIVQNELKVAIFRSTIDLNAAMPAGSKFGVVGGGAALLDNFSLIAFDAPTLLAGDFNRDGVVDAADYTVWRDGLGGEYDQDDYQTWRENYGRTSAAESPSNRVPTPTAAAMGAVAWAWLLARRQRPR